MTEYEFKQMLAEAVHVLGLDPVHAVVAQAVHDFGWPIPPNRYQQVLQPLAVLLHDQGYLNPKN